METDPDKTRMVRRGRSASPDEEDATRIITPSTQIVSPAGDGERTQLIRRPVGASSRLSTLSSTANGPGSSISDPVVGWLVVVAGPGKGQQVILGEQNNSVGRGGGSGEQPRVRLDFGDVGIARNNAFTIRYDPKKRRFKLLPGEGTNVVYHNEKDLDRPVILEMADVIEISKTQLLFIALCGPYFDWSDTFKLEVEAS